MPAQAKTAQTLIAEFDEAVSKYEAACTEDETHTASDEDHDAYIETMLSLAPDMAAILRMLVSEQGAPAPKTVG